ncbi:MAG: transcriptional regulator [Deltaproteobacteria bacterium HGW-Deltaproteobacteria-17]|nr:MAG: transcriptional regulator [Deltaproteobacteria bacterium HGW-Deltaproteobacteria-17]
MPLYEYHCNHCNADTEVLQDLGDPPLASCPKCKNADIHKKISVSSFRLTGSGWYETDFKNGGKCGPKSGGCSSCSNNS